MITRFSRPLALLTISTWALREDRIAFDAVARVKRDSWSALSRTPKDLNPCLENTEPTARIMQESTQLLNSRGLPYKSTSDAALKRYFSHFFARRLPCKKAQTTAKLHICGRLTFVESRARP